MVGPAREKELILTGRAIDAELAEKWGAVHAVVSPPDLLIRVEELAAELARCAPVAVSYGKRIIDQLGYIEAGLHLEAWAQNHLIQTEDFRIGVQAMLSKSSPEWKGM